MKIHRKTLRIVVVSLVVVLLLAVTSTVYASQHENLYNVPNEAGFTPCYVFNVDGWGDKWLNLNDAEYASCSAYLPYLTVYCMSSRGEWVNNTVDAVIYHPMSEFETGPVLTFTSTQHGHCGIFPTGEHLLE
jgi:hypothetical protein